jgi:hypothetical protein
LEGTKYCRQCPTIKEKLRDKADLSSIDPVYQSGKEIFSPPFYWGVYAPAEKDMIKTLRITGILAAILAGILFVFPVVFGVQSNEQVEQLLNSPSVVEKFNESKADKKTDLDSTGGGPLVKQAKAFALYLNPPKSNASSANRRDGSPKPRGSVEAKFTVVGTSFYAARPELSMAIIDEPGKGLRWIRQSSQIGHLVIEQIKDGMVVVKDGQRTLELAVQYGSALGLPVSTPASLGETLSRAEKSTFAKDSSSSRIRKPSRIPTSHSVNKSKGKITAQSSTDELNGEQSAALEKLIDRLKNLQKDYKSDKIDLNEPNLEDEDELSLSDSPDELEEEDEQYEEIISDFQTEQVSEEEAENLEELGEELNEGEEE